ncbi:hypothetical protein MACH24_11990 [Erythrobacter sp. Dej080120_24]|uniref:DUF4153 domain-containing protein n=1 Tax=unclassified Erythrobacter TaxID=2633097 RepID=UPI002921FF4D|nr:hypothetical protein MACH24_11990 [Erythrobacter sp. Dej080120_24]
MTDERSAVDDDASLNEWPSRPWALALMLGLAGAFVHIASDGGEQVPWRMAITAALVFGPLACAVTLSPERWKSSTLFAGGVALVMAGIAWRATSAGDRYADEGFWVAAGLLAVTLSVPLFQAGFHRHRWATSYKATHFHVWTDAITAAGALAFVGLSWALIAILAELFSAIRIELLKDLIEEEIFGWVYSGVTFGAALGVLRNQLKIIGTLQNVVLLVLSILAVPLAVALVLFLLAVALSGLDVLWEATRSATPLLLAIAVGCFVLANSVVRDDDEHASHSRVLRVAGFVLALGILPLSVMAALSMGTRIAQHGLSPERLWAIVSIAVAVAYGVAYFVSAIRGWRTLMEGGWREHLRQSNLHLAVLTCGFALILAMPIFNFGAISAKNQIARLDSGAVSAEDFDFNALRWDFGDAGRDALADLAAREGEVAKLAAEAQAMESRGFGPLLPEQRDAIAGVDLSAFDDAAATAIRARLEEDAWLCQDSCRVANLREDANGVLAVVLNTREAGGSMRYLRVEPGVAKAIMLDNFRGELLPSVARQMPEIDLDRTIELRPFTGQQVYIDGKPVGDPFK